MDVIEVGDQYYILAKSSMADDRTRVLKHGEAFAVFDRYGDIQPVGMGEQSSVVVRNFDVKGVTIAPCKADPVLIVNPNAVLSRSITS